jgi:arylsulfatase A-like enzyme
MERRDFLKSIGILGAGAAGIVALPGYLKGMNLESDKPWNIVFILADDMGWNQVGYGGTDFYETPNIDSIARSGMRLTQAYAPAPTCSPSRAGIMTGKYPARLHLTEYIPGDPYPWAKLRAPKMVDRLPLEEITLAEMLKPAGYVSAMIGKWHLNKDKNYKLGRPGDPESQGFDFSHPTVKPKGTANPYDDAHHAVEITNEALKFLDQNKNNPFFLYVAHHVVHRPIMEHADLIYKYQEKQGSDELINNPIMGAMIERMDTQIGRLLKKIDDLKLTDNTIVVFFSDNGGYNKLQAQDPLRGGKSMLFEGGIRVPFAIRWPGVIKPNSSSSVPVCGIDFFPTFAEITGIKKLPANVDGKNIAPLLKQAGDINRSALYWHYPHYHRFGYMPSGAIRKGRYKLIEWYERSFFNQDHPVSLFDLESDLGEKHDIADEMPVKAKELWEDLKEWRKNVGAQEMTKNPNFDPAKALFWNSSVNPNSADALGQYH